MLNAAGQWRPLSLIVRPKHLVMHSAFVEFPRERTEFSDATYAMLGRALAYATSFESICRALSSLQHIRQRVRELRLSIQDADDAFAAAVAEVWEQRLRQHVSRILEYQEFPSNVADTVRRAKSARNEIAHEIALGISHTAETDAGRSDLLATLSRLVHCIAQGYIIIELTSLIETHEPLPTPQFLSTYPPQIVEWVTKA